MLELFNHPAAPEAIIAIAALVLLPVGAFVGNARAALISFLGILVLVAAAIVAGSNQLGVLFNGAFVHDDFAAFAKVAIFLASAVAIYLGHGWLARRDDEKFEFPVLIMLAALGMSMMVSAGDLISLYIGVELQSLALYVLAAFRRDEAKASEAGLKYFVLGALSSGILLYGVSLIYGFTGSLQFADISAAVAGGAGTGAVFGLVFLICGLAFKVSAAPFHMWTPDVYEGAPTPMVAFFAAAPKLAAMVLFARAMDAGFLGAQAQWSQVLMVIAAISFVVGAVGGLVQKNIKRLLAYSSIANIGYAILGIAAGTQMGLQAMLVFMVLYMVDVTAFFAVIMALQRNGQEMDTIESLRGLKREKPGKAIVLTILSLSVLGMPPFSGFWAKYYVFKAAIGAGLWPIAVAGLVASVVAAFYYLRIIKVMWFDEPVSPAGPSRAGPSWVAMAGAAFSFPLVLVALYWLDPLARHAAAAFGLQ
ncbi:MAG: NADH-quinone oxidoreductase subunit NuoN [Caulobacteraceae bacterium]|nr:NADH-quinone oxidoreductase subunit NuoN [Caulobacteraceae bacterium]